LFLQALSGSSTRLTTGETGTGSRMIRDYFSEVVTLERFIGVQSEFRLHSRFKRAGMTE
jgi:hypothetical protein